MNSSLSLFATISELDELKQFLFNQLTHSNKSNLNSWDDEWRWDDLNWPHQNSGTTSIKSNTNQTPPSHGQNSSSNESNDWLSRSLLCISPMHDILVISHGNRFVILKASSPPKAESHFHIVSKVVGLQQRTDVQQAYKSDGSVDTISCLACIPIAPAAAVSSTRSQPALQPVPDWTLIVAGFHSGRVQFFADNGTLLLEQRFVETDSALVRVRLSTRGYYRATHGATASITRESAERSADVHVNSSSSSLSASPEEQVVLLFACGALVVIDAFDLLQAVRALRIRRARELASLDVESDSDPLSHSHSAPSYRRYLVDDYADARDFAIGAACVRQSRFDQLCAASLVGPREHIRATPPAHSLFLLCGAPPAQSLCFGSLAVLREADSLRHPLVEYSHALTRSLKSAFSSRFGIWRASADSSNSNSAAPQQNAQSVKTTRVQLRFGFLDSLREAVRLYAPFSDEYPEQCSPLVALVDNLSRVLLLEPKSGLVARVFKGYRDCQAGWMFVRERERQRPALASEPVDSSLSVESEEAADAGDARVAQCLVLYATKRGLVEVWLGSHGPRVAAFNVSPDGALLSTEHGCLGLGFLDAPVPAPAAGAAAGTGSGIGGRREHSLLSSSHTFYMSPGGQLFRVCVLFETLVQRDRGVRLADAQLLRRLNCVLDELRASAELDAPLAPDAEAADVDEALIANETYMSLERALCELFVQFSSPAQASRALGRVCACERLHVSTVSSLALRLRERFRRAAQHAAESGFALALGSAAASSRTCEPHEQSRCSELTCLEQQIQRVLSVAQLFALCSEAQRSCASHRSSRSPIARSEATLTGAAFASALVDEVCLPHTDTPRLINLLECEHKLAALAADGGHSGPDSESQSQASLQPLPLALDRISFASLLGCFELDPRVVRLPREQLPLLPPAAATAFESAASCIPHPHPVSNCISAAAPTQFGTASPTSPPNSSEPSSIDVGVHEKQQSQFTSSLDRVHWSRSDQTPFTSDYIPLRVSCANEHSGSGSTHTSTNTSPFELLGRFFFRSLLDCEEPPSDVEERAARAELTKLVDALLAAPVEPRAVLLCVVHFWLSRERQQRLGLGVGVGRGRTALDACLRSVRLLSAALRALERRCAALSSCELLVAALCANTSSVWAAYLLALVSRRLLLASPEPEPEPEAELDAGDKEAEHTSTGDASGPQRPVYADMDVDVDVDVDTSDGDGAGGCAAVLQATRTRMGVGVGVESSASRAHFDWSALLGKLYTLMQCEALLAAASQLTHCGSSAHSHSHAGPAASSSASALCIGASLRPHWSLAAAIERGAGVFSEALVERLLAAPCFFVVRVGDVDGGPQSTSDDVATAPAAAAASIASALRALTQHSNDEAESLSDPTETGANSELLGITGLAQFHVLFGTSN